MLVVKTGNKIYHIHDDTGVELLLHIKQALLSRIPIQMGVDEKFLEEVFPNNFLQSY